MKKFLLTLLIIVVVAVVAVLAMAMTKGDTFEVTRTAVINAPPEKIYPLINDFHRWQSWSPYEKKDPAMKRTYGGAPSGKGATYAWNGDKNVGSGSMEITESSSPSKVVVKLDFTSPLEGHNIAEFTMDGAGSPTRVTWRMHGPAPMVSKIVQVFFNLDTMIGKDFEDGLANLKAIAEK